jgi:hypothetical protein
MECDWTGSFIPSPTRARNFFADFIDRCPAGNRDRARESKRARRGFPAHHHPAGGIEADPRGRASAVVRADGRKDGSGRKRWLSTGFAKSTNGLLLMMRTTGGRGLDLPFAHYAVFYSPKSDPVTMWQEISRIRSTVSTPKDVHVLCYGDREVSVPPTGGERTSGPESACDCSVLDVDVL